MELHHSIATDLEYISSLQLLNNSEIAVTGTKEGIYLLRKYSYQGDVTCEKILEKSPKALVQINLADDLCLAVSYQKDGKIEFYKIDDGRFVSNITCAGPSIMCTISSTVLAYASTKHGQVTVKFLDCSDDIPVEHTSLQSIRLLQSTVWGMTFMGGKTQTLVVAGHGKICAYDIQAGGRFLWPAISGQLKGTHPGINPQDVAYNRDTKSLYVLCLEGYVYEISTTGKYMRDILSHRTHKIINACHLAWNKTHTQLIVQYNVNKVANISRFGYLNTCEVYGRIPSSIQNIFDT